MAVTGQTGGKYRLDRSSSARAVAASRRPRPRVDRPAILGLQMSTFLSIHGARFSFSFSPLPSRVEPSGAATARACPHSAGYSPLLLSDSACPDPFRPTPHPLHPSPSPTACSLFGIGSPMPSTMEAPPELWPSSIRPIRSSSALFFCDFRSSSARIKPLVSFPRPSHSPQPFP